MYKPMPPPILSSLGNDVKLYPGKLSNLSSSAFNQVSETAIICGQFLKVAKYVLTDER